MRAPSGAPTYPQLSATDGTRHSYGSLRAGLDERTVHELGEAQLDGIWRIARAALVAAARGDQPETARLALAAARLCEEIAGRWPPSAVEVPRR